MDKRFTPGLCLCCGEYVDVLLHIHAEQHGFKDAYEQIEKGMYKTCKEYNAKWERRF